MLPGCACGCHQVPEDPIEYYADPRAYDDPTFIPSSICGCCAREVLPQRPSPSTRMAVFKRDGYRCLACGSDEDISIDHVQHWSAGGRHGMENLRTLCCSCNSRRGAGHLPEVD